MANRDNRCGVVLVFRPGVTPAQAQDLMNDLYSRGFVEGGYGGLANNEPPSVQTYNDHGGNCGPVWYIP